MRFPLVFILTILFFASAEASKSSNRLEQLLIWKMSDELKLNALQEQEFAGIIKSLNSEKAQLTQDLQESLAAMSKITDLKLKQKELAKYTQILKKLNQLSESELKDIERVLGVNKLVDYLVLKQDIASRIKSSLTGAPEEAPAKKLPPPKVIEQK